MTPNLVERMESTSVLKVLRIAVKVLCIAVEVLRIANVPGRHILAFMSAHKDKNHLMIEHVRNLSNTFSSVIFVLMQRARRIPGLSLVTKQFWQGIVSEH